MKTNGQHQKDAVTTDQKFRDDDEHLHELAKRHLKESEENPEQIPGKSRKEKDQGRKPGGR